MTDKFEVVAVLKNTLTKELSATAIENETTIKIVVNRKHSLKKLFNFLKQSTFIQAAQLLDIFCVDYINAQYRFELNYVVLSLPKQLRFLIKTVYNLDELVESITKIYPSAGWLERETWDLYGIEFTEHPDLRRILTDYGFQGHPFRKDFPLTGYVQVRYDDERQIIVTENVELSQEFRNFDFLNPWEKEWGEIEEEEKNGN